MKIPDICHFFFKAAEGGIVRGERWESTEGENRSMPISKTFVHFGFEWPLVGLKQISWQCFGFT